jgi:hypothetical protein
MIASRTAIRSARCVRASAIPRSTIRNARLNSTTPNISPEAKTAGSSGLVGGITGGALVFLAGYGYYHFSGAKTIVSTASQTKKQFEAAFSQVKDSAPEPSEALKWLRQTTSTYAVFIPGAKGYVDAAFNDLDAIHAKHADDVDQIVKEAYGELKEASKSGLSMETAQKSWEILEKHLRRISDLAVDSGKEILDNHPQLKEKVGGNWDQLQKMSDNYGPEAKKQVEETWDQVKDVLKGGFSAETISKVKKLVDEKVEQVKKLGDEAWKKGLEQAKPYLDKSPKVKELLEKNADALKQGNVGELYEKVKESVDSGNTDSIESYIKDAVDKTKDTAKKSSGGSGGLEQLFKMVPGGDKIGPKLSQLQGIAQEHGDEAEKILKDTFKDIQDVLQKKVDEAQKLADKAQKEAKK